MWNGLWISNTEKSTRSCIKYTTNRYPVSMKMRLGYDTTEEILDVSILEKYPKECVFMPALENNCIKEAYT
jgi:hypothetical protein